MEHKLDLQKYKKLLLDERERILLEHRALSASAAEEGYELADYDNHPADAASDTYERTKDYAIDESFKAILEKISDALRKIEDGTYGKCDRCGGDINPNRLRAIPYATLCIECQASLERR
ncbi:TraR/DksA C4-type zinc finger protein [bacterium]|nr:TraR/DksA C4-type zinc finger protein [bacterium]